MGSLMSDVSFLGKVGWREDTLLSWPAFLSVMQSEIRGEPVWAE